MKTHTKQTPSQNAQKRPIIALAKRSDFAADGPRAVCVFALRSAAAATPGKDKTSMLEIFPIPGEYPGPVTLQDGTEIPDAIVVIDDQAYTNLIDAIHADQAAAEKAGQPWEGLLIDREHLSVMPDGDSQSFGWCKDLKKLEGQESLYATCELNSEGTRVTRDKIYLYRSPDFGLEHIEGKRFRPSRLRSIGLTNRPAWNLKSASAARTAANNQTKGKSMNPEEIIAQLQEKLGVDTPEEIISTVEALQTQVAEASDAETNREMEEFVKENEEEIEDPESFKEAYKKDPETAKALFTATRRKSDTTPSKPAPRRIVASTVRTRPIIGGADPKNVEATARRTAVQAEVRRLNTLGITGTAALHRAELSHGGQQ
jgi:hypothetical protein